MKKKKGDSYMLYTPISAKIRAQDHNHEYAINHALPDGYMLEQGFYSFPAEAKENYIVFDGTLYDVERYGSFEEIKNIIQQDLITNGEFTESEAHSLTENIEPRVGLRKYLDITESYEWLEKHPELKTSALKILEGVIERTEAKIEQEDEARKSQRRSMR